MERPTQLSLALDADLLLRVRVRARAIGRSLDDVVRQLLEGFVRDDSGDPDAVADALLALSARSDARRGKDGREPREELHAR